MLFGLREGIMRPVGCQRGWSLYSSGRFGSIGGNCAMALLIRAEEVTGILTMEEAIDAVEAGFREFGRNPELNAPRRRIMTPDGVRVSVHPGGVPSLGGI